MVEQDHLKGHLIRFAHGHYEPFLEFARVFVFSLSLSLPIPIALHMIASHTGSLVAMIAGPVRSLPTRG